MLFRSSATTEIYTLSLHDALPIADLVFWLIVGLSIGARYIDIVRYQGTTVDGEPATTAHFKRHALTLLVAGAAVWAVARALGPGFTPTT